MFSIKAVPVVILAVATASCGPRLVEVIPNGSVLPDNSGVAVEQARQDGSAEQAMIRDQRAAANGAAMASCTASLCDAIGRGELAVGMTEAEVLAATHTTADAWDVRAGGNALTMSSRWGGFPTSDSVGEIAFINFRNGRVFSYTYRESQGFRTVSSPEDATVRGRAVAQSDALVAQGDEYAAAGRLDLALRRYDQADVIAPGRADTNLRIASTLDKQLRPLEAVMRYQMFLHQMNLELIDARGDAAAKIAEAIARAHERIVVLERR